ncbi:MAG: MJ0307 family thioredoxin [Methanomicrobiales archaeon]
MNFKFQVHGGNKMVVKVEVFTSPTCPYCPMAIEVVDKAKKDLGDSIEVDKIDIMQDREKAIEYGLMAVPAVAINGVVKFVGAPSLEELMAALKEDM